MPLANDRQVGGAHYRTAYQHWDWVADTGMDYYCAAISKYISRHGKKAGLQDVYKASHFAAKLRELYLERGWLATLLGRQHEHRRAMLSEARDAALVDHCTKRFCEANPHFTAAEQRAMQLCATWRTSDDLLELQDLLTEVANTYSGGADGAYVNQDR